MSRTCGTMFGTKIVFFLPTARSDERISEKVWQSSRGCAKAGNLRVGFEEAENGALNSACLEIRYSDSVGRLRIRDKMANCGMVSNAACTSTLTK